MLCQIHQPFRLEPFPRGPEQIDPLPISRRGHTVWTTTISGEQSTIRRDVEVNRPLFTRHAVASCLACLHVHTCEPENLTLRCLQVVPDHVVWPKEFVPRDFYVHRAFVHQTRLALVDVDRPDAIDLAPF